MLATRSTWMFLGEMVDLVTELSRKNGCCSPGAVRGRPRMRQQHSCPAIDPHADKPAEGVRLDCPSDLKIIVRYELLKIHLNNGRGAVLAAPRG